jgi:nucleotide sugar dehydrogenase
VGTAVNNCFQERKLGPIGYDKYKDGGIGKPEDMLEADIVFLCLPTPYSEATRDYNTSSIHEVCEFLGSKKYLGTVVLKSTVEPGKTSFLSQRYSLNLVHNPEFLTAITAQEDFENQTHIVIGGPTDSKHVRKLSNFYKKHWPNAEQSICSSEESELMKLGVNCFYATKIQYFNELYLLAQKKNANYDKVVAMMLKNGWISKHHTKVPGTDGKLSYGGVCFPKDTNALCQEMYRNQTHHAVLEAVIEERNIMRLALK